MVNPSSKIVYTRQSYEYGLETYLIKNSTNTFRMLSRNTAISTAVIWENDVDCALPKEATATPAHPGRTDGREFMNDIDGFSFRVIYFLRFLRIRFRRCLIR